MSALLDELQELRAIRDRQVAEIQKLRAEIRELRRRQGEPEAAGRPLAGLKLTLVGPSFRQRDYLNILEPLGAKVLFYASDGKLGQITESPPGSPRASAVGGMAAPSPLDKRVFPGIPLIHANRRFSAYQANRPDQEQARGFVCDAGPVHESLVAPG